jgi:RimJ/RimL family protein N-acetyltransferase
MKFEILQTERLFIRRLKTEDAEAIARYRSLPEVIRFQSSYSIDRAKELILEMSESDPATLGKWFQFAIELIAEHRLIGDIGFLNTDKNGRSWVGFTLDPKYWNQGYATEAVQAVLGHYCRIGISNVWASTDPKNESSMRLLKKLGFNLVEEKIDDMIFVFSGFD